MQKMTIGNTQVQLFTVSEYNQRYGANMGSAYGTKLRQVVNAITLDADGDWDKTFVNILLGFEGDQWVCVKGGHKGMPVERMECTFFEGVQAMLEGPVF